LNSYLARSDSDVQISEPRASPPPQTTKAGETVAGQITGSKRNPVPGKFMNWLGIPSIAKSTRKNGVKTIWRGKNKIEGKTVTFAQIYPGSIVTDYFLCRSMQINDGFAEMEKDQYENKRIETQGKDREPVPPFESKQ
jgi:hypothetical protein